MTIRTKIAALAGALGLALLIAVTAVTGGGPTSALAAAATPGTGTQTSGTSFLSKLAANLGIGEDTLTAGVKQTNLQLIDEAVAAGQMTEAEAQAARDRVNSGEVSFGIGGKRGGQGRSGIGGGMQLSEATASFFGITTDQLRQDLQETGSLQGVAAKYGKDNATGKAALQAALATALRQQLTDKGVAADQIDARVAEFTQNFEQYYTSQRTERGPRGPQQSPAPSATPSAAG